MRVVRQAHHERMGCYERVVRQAHHERMGCYERVVRQAHHERMGCYERVVRQAHHERMGCYERVVRQAHHERITMSGWVVMSGWIAMGGWVAEPGGGVADGEQAAADDDGPGGGVDDVVDFAGLESRFQGNVFRVGEMPLRARDDGVGAVLPIADAEAGVGVVEVGDRVGAVLAVGEEAGGFGDVGAHLHAGLAGDGLAVDADFRRVQAEEGVAAINVPLPADGEDGVAVLEQETVALGYFGGSDGWRRGAVEEGDSAATAPVDDLDDKPAVAGRRVGRRDQGEVGLKADAAGVIDRGVLQVGDGLVGRVLRVNGVVEYAVDALVGAGGRRRVGRRRRVGVA